MRLFFLGLALMAGLAAAAPNPSHSQALGQSIALGTGVNGTYWVLDSLNWSRGSGTINVTFKAYLDKPTQVGGANALDQRSFTMPVPGNINTLAWPQLLLAINAFVKTQPGFTSAVDNP